MKIAPIAEVKTKFSSYVKQSEESPVVVTRNGKIEAIFLYRTVCARVSRPQ